MAKNYILTQKESNCIAVLYVHSYSSAFTGVGNTFGKVVVGKTYFISRIICDCAVPVFIFISAILFYSKTSPSYIESVKKNISNLLIPYLIFNTLWILIMLVRQHLWPVDLLDSDYINYGFWEWLDAYFGIKGDFKPALTVLWYIRDLFILKIMAEFLKRIIDKYPKSIFLINTVLWFSCIKSFIIHNYALVFLDIWILYC